MTKIKIYIKTGKSPKEISLPKKYTNKINLDLLNQATRVYEDRDHVGLSKVKTRSEIVRTKKKWYKQKGTGGARHGAKSAHIFVGGGVAHGPKGVKRVLSLPIKMRKRALVSAISFAFSNKRAVLVESLNQVKKTADASSIIDNIKKSEDLKKSSKILVVLSEKGYESSRFFKNLKNVKVIQFNKLNAYKLVSSGFVIFESGVIK